MANFSGRFSTNDKESTKVCNGLVEFYVDWQVIRDLENNTYKYKIAAYMDATRCKYLSTSTDKNLGANPSRVSMGESARRASGSFDMPTFKMLTFDTSKVLHLCSAESEAHDVGESDLLLSASASIYPNHTLHAYEKNMLSNVSSGYQLTYPYAAISEKFTVRGIAPHSIKSIDGNSYLGQPQTIQVTKTEPEFTHTIEYSYFKDNGEGELTEVVVNVCEKSSAESISFTPSEALAELNTHGTDIEATFRISTYYGNTLKGTKTYNHTFSVPDTIKPSCTVNVTDGEGLATEYGGYVQGHSRFHIEVVPTLAYSSPIQTYEIDVDGLVYTLTKPELDTALIKYSGDHSIKARVRDYRGHWSDVYSVTVDVIPYKGPVVKEISAVRCNVDGTENEKGDYLKVVFSSEVTPLSNKNTATYVVVHSKTSGLDYIERVLDDFTGMYTVTEGVYIFPADIDSTYVIQITAIDNFEEHSRTTGGGLTVILQSWLASGRGMCFGGIATIEDTVECQFKFYPSGGYLYPPYPYENLEYTELGVYYVEKPLDVSGSPTKDPYFIEIYPTDANRKNIVQRVTTCPQESIPRVLVRLNRQGVLSAWYDMTTGQAI